MKSVNDLIAERYERLAFIGADDRCPGTHAPAVSDKQRQLLRMLVEADLPDHAVDHLIERLESTAKKNHKSGEK